MLSDRARVAHSATANDSSALERLLQQFVPKIQHVLNSIRGRLMNNFFSKSLLTAAAVLASFGVATADVVVEVGNVATTAGSSVSVGITAFTTASDTLGSIDTPFDFGGDGAGLPAGLTYNGVVDNAGFDFGGAVGSGASPREDELVGGLSGAGISLSASSVSPTLLFTLNFTVDGSVAAGTVFDINILDTINLEGGASDFSVLNAGFTDVAGSPSNGSITVNAVPEPGSAILVIAAMAGLAVRRRRS